MSRRRARGFTLVELLVVLALLGILTALAVGSLGNLSYNQRINEVALEFYATVNKTRSEGMRLARNTVVQLQLASDVADVADIRIVGFVDQDGDYIYTEAGDGEPIHEHKINENFSAGLGSATYAEQLVFDDAPDLDFDGTSDGATFITSKWDGTAIPRTILFNSQGFSYDWGAAETEQVLSSVAIDISDPVNMGTDTVKRLEITVAGASRLRTCQPADGVCN